LRERGDDAADSQKSGANYISSAKITRGEIMGIKETLEYIHAVRWQGSKPGLSRTQELLRRLGNPEKKLKFVHVAGTNGKGSTSACIANVLTKADYKTGLYISPYIVCFNERMQINGEYISDENLEAMVGIVRPHADAMEDSPTEFELITALAMNYFHSQNCDIVVLEVGMGGRLDSTNVIETPELAVITAIGYDHVKELGPTISNIAFEKAGIIKSGGDVLVYRGEPQVEEVFEKVAAERGARLTKVDFSRIKQQEFSLSGTTIDFSPYGKISLSLAGAYQPKNAAVAITALEMLRNKGYKISDEDIIAGIGTVKWPGRFEILGQDPVFILDGAHNPQGAEAAIESLRTYFGERKFIFLMGVMADKDLDQIVSKIAPSAKTFFAVSPDYKRAMDAHTLAEKLSKYGVPTTACESVSSGVEKALELAEDSDIICALGSLYFSGEVKGAYLELTK